MNIKNIQTDLMLKPKNVDSVLNQLNPLKGNLEYASNFIVAEENGSKQGLENKMTPQKGND